MGEVPGAPFAALLPPMLRDVERLVCCESPSADLAAVAASADLVAAVGTAQLGQPPEVLVVDGRTHLRWRTVGTGPRVLLLGHHDTVWPIGSLQSHPWRVDEGPGGAVARGPGCFDMKVGLVQMLYAVGALADRSSVTILVTGDEEIGSPTSRELIEAEARQCVAALVLEASGPGGALKTQRKGVSQYELEVQGRAAHAGLDPDSGINAGIELAAQVLRIATFGDRSAGTSVTPTALSAGTTGNTVPAAGRLAVDVRSSTRSEQERVDALMHSLPPTLSGSRLTVRGGANRPVLERRLAAGLFALASRCSADLGLGELAECAVGGASDGNFTAGAGVPTLDGLGAVGGGAHADDEHVLIGLIPARTALLAALVEALRGGAATPTLP